MVGHSALALGGAARGSVVSLKALRGSVAGQLTVADCDADEEGFFGDQRDAKVSKDDRTRAAIQHNSEHALITFTLVFACVLHDV